MSKEDITEEYIAKLDDAQYRDLYSKLTANSLELYIKLDNNIKIAISSKYKELYPEKMAFTERSMENLTPGQIHEISKDLKQKGELLKANRLYDILDKEQLAALIPENYEKQSLEVWGKKIPELEKELKELTQVKAASIVYGSKSLDSEASDKIIAEIKKLKKDYPSPVNKAQIKSNKVSNPPNKSPAETYKKSNDNESFLSLVQSNAAKASYEYDRNIAYNDLTSLDKEIEKIDKEISKLKEPPKSIKVSTHLKEFNKVKEKLALKIKEKKKKEAEIKGIKDVYPAAYEMFEERKKLKKQGLEAGPQVFSPETQNAKQQDLTEIIKDYKNRVSIASKIAGGESRKESNLHDYLQKNNVKLVPLTLETNEEGQIANLDKAPTGSTILFGSINGSNLIVKRDKENNISEISIIDKEGNVKTNDKLSAYDLKKFNLSDDLASTLKVTGDILTKKAERNLAQQNQSKEQALVAHDSGVKSASDIKKAAATSIPPWGPLTPRVTGKTPGTFGR